MKRVVVIMAGGSGERFWPLSRMSKPKQLLALTSEKMMLEEAIDRVAGIIPNEDIFIITSEVLLNPIREALPQLPAHNIIAEPFKRNTAPCLALAAGYIAAKYAKEFSTEQISVSVLTADQEINPTDGFKTTVTEILNFVESNEAICTIGINPSRPETGYGYVETASSFKDLNRCEILPVKAFHEKPNIEKAKEYSKSGVHFWNSGMFFFRLDTFINGMIKYLPEVGSKIADIQHAYLNNTEIAFDNAFKGISSIFEQFPDISIDYGLMEQYDNIYTANALFEWDDVGSWDALDRVKSRDENGNIVEGIEAIIDCNNSIFVNKTSGKIAIGAIGLDDFVVVVTDDSVMICPKDKVQDVKKCVQKLKSNDLKNWI